MLLSVGWDSEAMHGRTIDRRSVHGFGQAIGQAIGVPVRAGR